MKYCSKCGNKVSSESKFCSNCGFNLSKGNTNVNDDISNTYHNYRDDNNSYNVKQNNDVHPGQKEANIKKTRDSKSVWIKKEYAISLLTFWIKGRISVDYRGVHIRNKNTMLGLIPAGDDIQDIPLRNISGSNITTQYKTVNLVVGIILALLGFSTLITHFIFGLILLIIGVGLFSNGIITQLNIEMSGNYYSLRVPFINKSDLQLVNSVINEANNGEEDKQDMSLYWNRKK